MLEGRTMEIKLKTTLADPDKGLVVDEHGVLWKHVTSKPVHGIFPATTEGVNGESIRGFYRDGSLFILDVSEARKYFSSIESEYCGDLPNL
jgi:hypothetical protein